MANESPPKALPEGIRLDTLKSQAKELLKAVQAGEPSAAKRIKPYFTDAVALTLQRAQLVVAREYGFDSWRKLKTYIQTRDELQVASREAKAALSKVESLLERRMSDLKAVSRVDPHTPHCSFCHKSGHEVGKLIAGNEVYICDACVAICEEILREENETGS